MTKDISYSEYLTGIFASLGIIAFSSAVILHYFGVSFTTMRNLLWEIIELIHLGFWIIIGPIFFLDMVPTIYFSEPTKEILWNSFTTYGIGIMASLTADRILKEAITEEDNEKLEEVNKILACELNNLYNQRKMSQ